MGNHCWWTCCLCWWCWLAQRCLRQVTCFFPSRWVLAKQFQWPYWSCLFTAIFHKVGLSDFSGCFFSTAVGGLRSFENPKNKITAVPAAEEEIWGATFKVMSSWHYRNLIKGFSLIGLGNHQLSISTSYKAALFWELIKQFTQVKTNFSHTYIIYLNYIQRICRFRGVKFQVEGPAVFAATE